MNVLKRPFCKHNYQHYNTVPVYLMFGGRTPITYYHFVCTKCGKTVKISEFDIKETIEAFDEKYRKKLVLGKAEEIESKELTLNRASNYNIFYRGVGVTLAIDFYKSKGVDIQQVSSHY